MVDLGSRKSKLHIIWVKSCYSACTHEKQTQILSTLKHLKTEELSLYRLAQGIKNITKRRDLMFTCCIWRGGPVPEETTTAPAHTQRSLITQWERPAPLQRTASSADPLKNKWDYKTLFPKCLVHVVFKFALTNATDRKSTRLNSSHRL